MSSLTLTQLQDDLVRSVVEKKDIIVADCTIDVQAGSMKGDGYMGIIHTVHVKNKSTELNLILKSALTSEQLRKQAPIRKAYEREIFLYTNVFPQFEAIQESVIMDRNNQFREYAKCYGTLIDDRNECLVLENLRELGYRMWNRKKTMDPNHLKLVVQTYGKFHAMSQVLKQLKPETYDTLTAHLDNIFEDFGEDKMRDYFGTVFETAFKSVESNAKAIASLKQFVGTVVQFFVEDVKVIDKYSVINHGDCWCNNIMFKYEDMKNTSKPTDICLLDWQIARVGSPVFDLSYFFYSCGSKENLYDLQTYLRLYHDSFAKTLREFQLDPDQIMSFSELQEQWKLYSKYGMVMSMFIIKVMLTEAHEAIDLSEIADSGKNMIEAFSDYTITSDKYMGRIGDIITFMSDNDYL